MKVYFDSSVLASVLNVQSVFHAQACQVWKEAKERVTSCHGLAETYRTLTSMQKPLTPDIAGKMILEMSQHITLVTGEPDIYRQAVKVTSEKGLQGAIVHDAVHVTSAKHAKADRIITRNKRHFVLFADVPVDVLEDTPGQNRA